MIVPSRKIKIEIVLDTKTQEAGFRVRGVLPGDERLVYQLLGEFGNITKSEAFKKSLINTAFSKKLYKSKDPNVAPIWRRESGKYQKS